MTRIKICGCRTPEQALAAAEAGADFIGLMFAESKRRVSHEEASEIVRALGTPLREREMLAPPALFRSTGTGMRSWFDHGALALDMLLHQKRPLTVGVFANNDPEEINETVDQCGIDLVQLSGDEAWGACLMANRQVIKALHISAEDTHETAMDRIEAGAATAILLDRAASDSYGGTGLTIDWAVAARLGDALQVWLAGGLTPDNVVEAIRTVRPWCVDVSSGVETDGTKDIAKIRAFVRAAKSA